MVNDMVHVMQGENLSAKTLNVQILEMSHAVDRGRAWFVLATAVSTAALTVGNAMSLGTLFDYIEKYFQGSAGTISLLFALTVSLNFFVGENPDEDVALLFCWCSRRLVQLWSFFPYCLHTGAFAGPVTEIIGYRKTIAAGAGLSMVGFGFSVFATRVWHLYLTLGLVVGTGFGLVFTPSVGVLSHYFDRYFHLAGTASTTGIPVGVMIYSKLHPVLLEHLNWTKAMLVEAALCSLLFIGVFVIKESPKPGVAEETAVRTGPLQDVLHGEQPVIIMLNSSCTKKSGVPVHERSRGALFIAAIKTGFRLDLFREVEFYLLMLSGLAMLGADLFVVMTPKYLVDTHKWSKSMSTVSLILITFGASSLIVRVLLITLNAYPRWADRLSKPLQVAFGIGCIATASLVYLLIPTTAAVTISDAEKSRASFPTENNSAVFFIFAAVCGVGDGFFFCYQVSLLKDLLGSERLTASFGYLNCAWGIGTIACYSIAGVMGDTLKTMRYTYAVAVGLCLISEVSLFVVVVAVWRKKRSRDSQ